VVGELRREEEQEDSSRTFTALVSTTRQANTQQELERYRLAADLCGLKRPIF
jgi:hypothetical protein